LLCSTGEKSPDPEYRKHVLHAPIKLSILAFASALVASLALTYVVRERARRARLFDPTDERKLHTQPIPRVGGVAIFWSVSLALLAMTMLAGFNGAGLSGTKLLVILVGGVAIHILGLWDDLKSIRARYKFAIQIAISIGIFAAGVRIDTIALPLLGQISFGPFAALLFTIFWFVGITNAFNLIDGLDGLASGAAMFALTTMFVVATINGQAGAALVTLAVAGATLGFLRYNFHPASIFLGDSGSLYLGFMLAGIGAISSQKGSTVVAIAIPLVSLGLPVLDTSLAIARRFLRGQPIFTADRGHIHHRLLNLGHSPAKVALLMYAGCAVLALGGMLLVNQSGYVAVVLAVVGLGVGLVVQQLRYYEFEELGRLLRKGVQQRNVIGKRVRIREAGMRIARLRALDRVFDVLEDSFAADDFERAEVRLRQSFAKTGSIGSIADRRLDDDVAIWSWNRGDHEEPTLWEIKLPLLKGKTRIGSLVLWKDGAGKETALSHVHAIAGQLRVAVQEKLAELWPAVAIEKSLWGVRSSGGTNEDEILVPIVAGDELHRRREERAIAEPRLARPAGVEDAGRRPRAS
jgi:UDP-GlcNAc:undecaprenyl-phosphate GlcNAc-1-phosphate transferase